MTISHQAPHNFGDSHPSDIKKLKTEPASTMSSISLGKDENALQLCSRFDRVEEKIQNQSLLLTKLIAANENVINLRTQEKDLKTELESMKNEYLEQMQSRERELKREFEEKERKLRMEFEEKEGEHLKKIQELTKRNQELESNGQDEILTSYDIVN